MNMFDYELRSVLSFSDSARKIKSEKKTKTHIIALLLTLGSEQNM